MTSEQVAKAKAFLDAAKEMERKVNPGQCKMLSKGDDCSCVLCLCDELRGLLKAHISSEGAKDQMTDSFQIIKALFERSPEPTHAEALAIFDALHDVNDRLLRVRQFSPTADYSAKVWRLIGMVGMKEQPLGAPPSQTAPRDPNRCFCAGTWHCRWCGSEPCTCDPKRVSEVGRVV